MSRKEMLGFVVKCIIRARGMLVQLKRFGVKEDNNSSEWLIFSIEVRLVSNKGMKSHIVENSSNNGGRFNG